MGREKTMNKDTVSAYRARAKATEDMVTAAVTEMKAERDAEFAAAKMAAAKRNRPVAFTDAEYKVARVIRTRLGWYEVAKVNPKSALVRTGHSWHDRVLRSQILEVKS